MLMLMLMLRSCVPIFGVSVACLFSAGHGCVTCSCTTTTRLLYRRVLLYLFLLLQTYHTKFCPTPMHTQPHITNSTTTHANKQTHNTHTHTHTHTRAHNPSLCSSTAKPDGGYPSSRPPGIRSTTIPSSWAVSNSLASWRCILRDVARLSLHCVIPIS
jgi:hypothetical protein